MDIINVLPNELLVNILSFVPTKVAVSTSILSKRWEFLWKWVPKIEYDDYRDITDRSWSSCQRYQDFIDKNLPLHKAPIIESLCLRSSFWSHQLEDIKLWVGMTISRCVRELSIDRYSAYTYDKPRVVLPISLYTCKTLVTLKLDGKVILVDVPPKGCLPSLKTLRLRRVKYLNRDDLELLLSYCPVLEDLVIQRDKKDNVKGLVVIVPSLQRLSLDIDGECSYDEYVIDTPSLKYFKVEDHRYHFSYAIRHMPKLEEADIFVARNLQEFLNSITSAKRLSLQVYYNSDLEAMYSDGIVFNQLEHLKLHIQTEYWSKLLVRLLKDSPKLQVLNLKVGDPIFKDYERSLVRKYLLENLDNFEFTGYKDKFLIFISKNAPGLTSTTILSSSM